MFYKKMKRGKYDKYIENAIFFVGVLAILAMWYYFFMVSEIFKNFLEWLDHFVQTQTRYAYLIAYLAAVAEGTIILGMVPGTTFVITMGVFLARGTIDPYILFPIVIIGAFLGDLLGYAIGSFVKKWFVNSEIEKSVQFQLGEKFVHKHGAKSVFLARFISGIKEVIPFLAGVLKMNMKRFMAYNFLGAIGWSILWIGVGYVSGLFVTDIESIVKSIGLVLLVIFLFAVFAYYKKNLETFTEK
ncbi:hypothetical protein CSB11_01545 [Candidatus Campbellbacteria bacterium]|nr:MAG: hypothetical protein CSB11_01545 [Candidatus Campbellbacteria bacterium]